MSKKVIVILLVGLSATAAGLYYFATSKSAAHLQLIPKEATFVMKFDSKALRDKAGLSRTRLKEYFGDIRNDMDDALPEGVDNVMKKMSDDPQSVGVDLMSDIFIFYQGGKREEVIGWTFAIKNKKDFHETLENLFEDEDADFDEKEKFSLAVIENYGGYTAVGWDDEKGILLFSDNNSYSYYDEKRNNKNSDDAEETIEELFTLKKESTVLSQPGFQKFIGQAKDISFWVSADVLKGIASSDDMDELKEELGIDLDDAAYMGFFDFREDRIIATGSLVPNEQMKARQEKAKVMGEGVPSKLLQNLPRKSYATLAVSVNPDGVYTQLSEEGSFRELKEEFKKEAGVSLKEFFEGLGGNLICTVHDFRKHTITKSVPSRTYDPYWGSYNWTYEDQETEETLPSFAVLFDLRDNELFDDLIEPHLTKKKGNYYAANAEGVNFFLSNKDNMVAISNDEDYIEDFSDGKISENFTQNELSSEVKETAGLFHCNLDYDSYPDEVQDLMESEMPGAGVRSFKKFIKHFNHFQVKSIDENTFEAVVGINNKTGDNSLKLLFDEIKEMLD